MGTRIQIRRDTSTNWYLNNPVLALGEPGLETDTQIVKYGDGVSAWNDLVYANIASLDVYTTANLAEYSANLYYTNARVYANVLSLGLASNSQLSVYATNAQLSSYALTTSLDTANVLETTNQYYTNAKVYANVISIGIFATNNQLSAYATNAQLTDYATTTAVNLKANVADLTTSNVTEGTNLYYSNNKAQQFLEAPTTYITFNAPFRVPRLSYDAMIATVASNGQIVFETSNNLFRGFNGTTWSILG